MHPKRDAADRLCYVNNFDDLRKPIAIALPAGSGVRFRDDSVQTLTTMCNVRQRLAASMLATLQPSEESISEHTNLRWSGKRDFDVIAVKSIDQLLRQIQILRLVGFLLYREQSLDTDEQLQKKLASVPCPVAIVQSPG